MSSGTWHCLGPPRGTSSPSPRTKELESRYLRETNLAVGPELHELAVASPQGHGGHLGGAAAELLHQQGEPAHPDLPVLDLVLWTQIVRLAPQLLALEQKFLVENINNN